MLLRGSPMPFQGDAVDAICRMVDAIGEPEKYRKARREFRRALNVRIFLPHSWRKDYIEIPRSVDQLQLDLLRACDEIRAQKLKVWALTLVVTMEGAVIGWMATRLVDCLSLTHQVAAIMH